MVLDVAARRRDELVYGAGCRMASVALFTTIHAALGEGARAKVTRAGRSASAVALGEQTPAPLDVDVSDPARMSRLTEQLAIAIDERQHVAAVTVDVAPR